MPITVLANCTLNHKPSPPKNNGITTNHSCNKLWSGKLGSSFTIHKPPYPYQLPEGWVWTTVGDICDTCLGKMLDKTKNNGSLKTYLRNINVRWGNFDLADLLSMPFRLEEQERFQVIKGDLVVCEGGEPGRCAIWNKEYPIMFQKALHRIRCFSGVFNKYIAFVIESYACSNVLGKYFTGSTIKHLTGESLNSIIIPLPPCEEQKRIVSEIERWRLFVGVVENGISDLKAVICQAKSKILGLAIHGKLVPQDPSDEPASELLKRINPKAEITCDNPRYGKLPKGWCLTTFKGAFKDISSKPFQILQSQIKIKGKHPVISQSSNFIEGYSDEDVLSKCDTPIIIFGDHTRNVKYVDFDFIVGADGVKIIKPYIDTKYAYYMMIYAASHIVNKGYSRHFSQISKLSYYIPPLTEQYRIVAKIEELFAQLGKIESSL